MTELCPPCKIKEIKTIEPRIKSLVYRDLTNNLGKLIDEEYINKNCRPNLYKELGNDDPKTATDRFNLQSYNELIESIENSEPIIAPELD